LRGGHSAVGKACGNPGTLVVKSSV
jgi:hypothetical protein